MANTTTMRAVRIASAAWNLFDAGMKVPFGTLTFTQGGWAFEGDGEFDERPGYVQHRLRPDMDLRAALAVIRAGSEAMFADWRRESAAEMAAEGAWLRHAELPTNDDLGFAEWEQRNGVIS
jgi:hypothetical protein